MLDYTNMSISYEAGNEKNTETVTGSSWSKEFKVKLPGTISVSRAVTLRDDKTIPAEESFSYTKGYSVSWKFQDENGKDIKTGGVASIGNTTSGKGAKLLFSKCHLQPVASATLQVVIFTSGQGRMFSHSTAIQALSMLALT